MSPLHRLRRHPIPIACRFDRSLVLTWALPAEVLAPLVPRGLALDTYEPAASRGEPSGRLGFVAVAVVQTRALRPRGAPEWMGRSFALVGYRIFVRHSDATGRIRRGLHILSSDTDSVAMRWGGSLLTHYGYRKSTISIGQTVERMEVHVSTAGGAADLDVLARLDPAPAALPAASPFPSAAAARRYAGPLPWTFDHEAQTDSIVMVRGRRSHWRPHPIAVEVERATFFTRGPFAGTVPRLANAFTMDAVEYSWDRGVAA